MICPDCNTEMVKSKIECHDLSGWMVGWLCECKEDNENIQVTIHSDRDWTADQIVGSLENEN